MSNGRDIHLGSTSSDDNNKHPHKKDKNIIPMDKPILLPTPTNTATNPIINNKLTLIPLIFIIFFEVAGGPYGSEPAVEAAGPLFAILGFVIFPFIWALPESLVTAELSTALPGNGGFVIWADRAFGPFPGSLMGTWKFLSGVINSAAFPALCIDYLARVVPVLSNNGPRTIAIVVANVVLSFLNYLGLSVVGWGAVVLGVASLSPFVLMTGWSLPKLRPHRWGVVAEKKDWTLFFNTLFWNLNFWDSASTMAGEVDQPGKTFPKALVVSVFLSCLGYVIPLMAATGAIDSTPDAWGNGYFADAAGIIAGGWLQYWVEVGAVLSAIGLYEAQLSSNSYQLVGMADLGLLPRFFSLRAKWFGTPWVGILFSSVITFGISFLSFNDIIMSANFLYSLGMLLEFAAFLWLRAKHPELHRPYRVPFGMPYLIIMCFVPSAFLVYIMVIAGWKVWLISIGFTIAGIGVYFLMNFCKARGCLKFSSGDGDEVDVYEQPNSNGV